MIKNLDIGSVALYRVASMAGGFIAASAAVALVTREYGVQAYALFTLLVSLLGVLPFADLGLGIGLVNATADYRATRISQDDFKRALRRTLRLLLIISLVMFLTTAAISFSTKWRFLLGPETGEPAYTTVAVFLAFTTIALGLPLGIGARIQQGMGMVKRTALISVAQGPINLALLVLLVSFGFPAPLLVLAPAIAFLAVNALTFIDAIRKLNLRTFRVPPLADQGFDRYRVTSSAIPFFIVSVSNTAAFQLDRVILGRFSSMNQLADYSLVAQFAVPLGSVLALTAQNLWPHYRNELESRSLTSSMFARHVTFFLLLGISSCVVLWPLVLILGTWLAQGAIQPSPIVLSAACAQLLVLALHRPGGMLLNDPRGLWIQASLAAAMALVNVPLTILGSLKMGAAGPFFASALSMLLIQTVPTWVIVARKLASLKKWSLHEQ